ncbi:hypothetical protein GCM10010129_79950 [Streptomyces fumigatiscleroticus]|nr:hypothetical protein GCM10010129_79950 [Streptomyces fumigatiscleroticus]
MPRKQTRLAAIVSARLITPAGAAGALFLPRLPGAAALAAAPMGQ